MTSISVIIPTKDRPVAVHDAVRSVLASDYPKLELWVIDQSVDNTTCATLAPLMSDRRFHYWRNERRGVGAAASRNLGIALSSGELVAIIDDDVTVRHDWLANIVAQFTADPMLQFICGKLSAPPYDWRQGYVPSFNAEPAPKPWIMPLAAAGANFSMRRSLFDRLGGYDESCGPGSRLGASDDGDIAFRIMRSGARWKACPEIEVVHSHGFRTLDQTQALLKRYQRGIGGNYGRFTRRGDLLAGIWFLGWQFRELAAVVLPNLLLGRRPTRAGWLLDRIVGFWHGMLLSPNQGYVTGEDLRHLRSECSKVALNDSGE